MGPALAGVRLSSMLGAILLLLVCVTTYAFARIEILNIEKLFNSADAVLVVYIEEGQTIQDLAKDCGVRYTGIVRRRFKDMPQPISEEISFGRHLGLMRGGHYLLFLNYIPDASAYYESFRHEHQLPEPDPGEKRIVIQQLKCQGIIPGFVHHPKAAWEVKLSYVIVNGIRPEMPNNIDVISGGDLMWLINKDDLFAYLRSLGAKRR